MISVDVNIPVKEHAGALGTAIQLLADMTYILSLGL